MLTTTRLLALTLTAFTSSCTSSQSLGVTSDQHGHLFAIGKEGRSRVTKVDGRSARDDDYTAQLGVTAKGLKGLIADKDRENRVLLYFHGGMNGIEAGGKNAKRILRRMQEDRSGGSFDAYPILVNWDSGPGTSFFYGLFCTLQGQSAGLVAFVAAPFKLVAALGRALAHTPETLLWQGAKNIGDSTYGISVLSAPAGWETRAQAATDKADPGFIDRIVKPFVPGALRVVTTPLADTWGLTAYADMRRTAELAFNREAGDALASSFRPRGSELAPGVLAKLADQLSQLAKDQRCTDYPLRITVAAHSLGAHIANQLLSRYPELPVDQVIFLAPACSMKEFSNTTLEFIRHSIEPTQLGGKPELPCEFYCLSLHPHREYTESTAWGIAPHGSLLVYIDDYLTSHHSLLDATLGNWNNTMRALPALRMEDDLREQLHFKMFDWDSDVQTHGDIDNTHFWLPQVHWDSAREKAAIIQLAQDKLKSPASNDCPELAKLPACDHKDPAPCDHKAKKPAPKAQTPDPS